MPFTSKIARYLFVILVLSFEFSGNSQNISFKLNKSTLYRNDFLCISITFNQEAKKEYHYYQDYLLPEIPNFVKSHTYFQKTDEGGVIHQWYEPIQTGTTYFPSLLFYNRHHKAFTFHSQPITVLASEHANPDLPPATPWIAKVKLSSQRPTIKWYISGPTSSQLMEGKRWSAIIELPLSESVEYAVPSWNSAQEQIKKWMSHQSFLHESLLKNGAPVIDTVVVDEKTYLKILLVDEYIFPTQVGDIFIPSFSLPYYIYKKGDCNDGIVRLAEEITLGTPEFTWRVRSLKGNSPSSTVVGNFTLSDIAEQSALRLGKSTYITLTLEGNGELSTMGKPIFRSNQMELLSSEVLSSGIVSYQPWIVRKQIRYHIKPTVKGNIHLANAFTWAYFNLQRQQWDTLRPHSTIHVYQSATGETPQFFTEDPFYQRYTMVVKEGVRQQVETELINRLANLIIFLMLVVTAILVIKK